MDAAEKNRPALFVKHSMTANVILAFTEQRKTIYSCRKSHSRRTSNSHNKLKQRNILECGVQTSTDKMKKSHEKELRCATKLKANEISARFAMVLCNKNNDINEFSSYADAFLIANLSHHLNRLFKWFLKYDFSNCKPYR